MNCDTVNPEYGTDDISYRSLEFVNLSPEAPSYSPISCHDVLSVLGTVPSPTTPSSETETYASVLSFQVPVNTSTPVCSLVAASNKWCGFKIVMDNIDMNIRPRHQTFERQTQSLHYVNSYAVKDRIDFSSFEHATVNTVTHPESLQDVLLPSANDREALMANFVILAGRILCDVIPALNKIPGLTTKHIQHLYSKEMSSKSEIVSNV